MKRKLNVCLNITIAVLALFSLVSCYENVIDDSFHKPDVDEEYYEVNEKVCILKEEMIQYIDEMVNSDSLLVFRADTPEEALPKEGTFLFVPVSENTPYGFLARVDSIERGDKIKVHTSTLALEEVFEYLSIDETTDMQSEFVGVFDDEGNPIAYEIMDTTDIDLNDISVNAVPTRSVEAMEWDKCIKFPMSFYKSESGNNKVEVNGAVYVGFKDFDFDADISIFNFKYLNLTATPFVKVAGSINATTGRGVEATKRLAQLRYRLTFPTPLAGIPLIVPVTVYVYGTVGASGEIGATLTLQYDYECKANVRYRNGNWSSDIKHGGFDNKSPWIPGEFSVKGEVYAGAKIGVLVGLYSATSGIGLNSIPKVALGAEAKLSSEDLLKVNPEVYLSFAAGSEIYCVAEIFGWKLGKYTMELPELTLWKGNTYLLPNISDFEAKANKSSADITWKHDSFYFLEPLGLRTGATVFESDMVTEVDSYEPDPVKYNFYTSVYSANAEGLKYGKKYYAAPYATWGNNKWYGDMVEFTTEASNDDEENGGDDDNEGDGDDEEDGDGDGDGDDDGDGDNDDDDGDGDDDENYYDGIYRITVLGNAYKYFPIGKTCDIKVKNGVCEGVSDETIIKNEKTELGNGRTHWYRVSRGCYIGYWDGEFSITVDHYIEDMIYSNRKDEDGEEYMYFHQYDEAYYYAEFKFSAIAGIYEAYDSGYWTHDHSMNPVYTISCPFDVKIQLERIQ